MANNSMTISSKFNKGLKVWAFRQEDGKFYEGTISDVQSWDKWGGFRYEIKHEGAETITLNAEERFIFLSKEEIIQDRFISETPVNSDAE